MPEPYPHLVIARIPEHMEPFDRDDRYEEPLAKKLYEYDAGEVTGGGTRLAPDGGIAYIDLELHLKDLDAALELCKLVLEFYGAPKGSQFLCYEGEKETKIPFGTSEGVALLLDGVNLPKEVYEKYGLGELMETLQPSLGREVGDYHSCRTLDEVTEVYFYGPSADRLLEVIAPLQQTFPLCQNSTTRKLAPPEL
jgi:hypothetical protein